MTDTRQKSPLAHRNEMATDHISLVERAFIGMLILRGERNTVAANVSAAIGCEVPAKANRSTQSNGFKIMWLSPDEWLIMTKPGEQAATKTKIDNALADSHYQLVDVSDYYTTIAISGAKSRELLMKLSTIDLHHQYFKAGDVAATLFGHTSGWLRAATCEADGSDASFDLVVRRSMADYLWCILAESGLEWGLPEQDPIGLVKLHLPHFEEA